MRFLTLPALAILTASALSCASPTAPSRAPGGIPGNSFSLMAAHARADTTSCNAFEGEARGLCHALINACSSATGGQRPPGCTELAERFQAVTGRQYIAFGEQCSVIRFVCAEGSQPFYDPVGCGCEPIR